MSLSKKKDLACDTYHAISTFQPGDVAIIFTPSMKNGSANTYKDEQSATQVDIQRYISIEQR